jgi:hypothetical protein
MKYIVSVNPDAKEVAISPHGESVPTGFEEVTEFFHGEDTDSPEVPETDNLGFSKSHTIYSHVKDILFANGQVDVKYWKIIMVFPVQIDAEIKVEQTIQLDVSGSGTGRYPEDTNWTEVSDGTDYPPTGQTEPVTEPMEEKLPSIEENADFDETLGSAKNI